MTSDIKARFYCRTHGYIKFGFGEQLTELYFNQRGGIGAPCPLCHKSRPLQVELCTGIKDKNGVEIYEGDIVALDMWHGNDHGYIPEDGLIKWHEQSVAFKWFSLEEDASDGNNYWLSQADHHQREVIGNIHENPELLKEVQNDTGK